MDRTYQNMLAAAKERLQGKNPYKIAENAKIIYDENSHQYRVPSLGKELIITYPDYECTEKLDSWCHLVILHYMDLADGTELSGDLISFGSLKDGMIRGTKFDHTVEIDLQKIMRAIPDTTETMFSPNRYREYTKDELVSLSKKEKY